MMILKSIKKHLNMNSKTKKKLINMRVDISKYDWNYYLSVLKKFVIKFIK